VICSISIPQMYKGMVPSDGRIKGLGGKA
jgi:hypothetical protein